MTAAGCGGMQRPHAILTICHVWFWRCSTVMQSRFVCDAGSVSRGIEPELVGHPLAVGRFFLNC